MLLRVVRAPLVALASLAVVMALGLPVSAGHVTLEVDWSAPGSDPTIGTVVEDTVSVQADVNFDGGLGTSNVKEWQAQLRDESGGSVAVLCTRSLSGLGEGTATVDFTWDSRYFPSGTVNTECEEGDSANVDTTRPLPNDRYLLRLRAHDQVLTTEWHHDDFAIRVNNPPSTPRDVSAAFAEDEQEIRVTWTANPEPDLSGYLVEQCRTESESDSDSESCASADWETLVENAAGDVDAVVEVTEPGAYHHRVVALRPDWSQGETLTSSAAGTDSAIVLEDGSEEEPDDPTSGEDPSGPDDSGSDDPASTLPEQAINPDQGDPASGTGTGAGERRRSLEPRLVQRESFDPGFEEALPYGARTVDDTPPRADGLLVGQEGGGSALVPIAGGLVVFVFAMQLRYLGRRASLAAAGGGGMIGPSTGAGGDGGSGDSGRADGSHGSGDRPSFRPLLGGSSEGPGSFISNWKRWIPKG